MLMFGEKFIDMPILSLQTGQEVARTEKAVIDPTHLTVVAYYVNGQTLDFSPALLRVADIREIGKMGAIINSSDEFISPDDIVKLQKVLELDFILDGMNVIDDHKQKLGKVFRYTLDPETFVIHQLHIKRPLLKSFNDSQLLIHRSQIIAISKDTITVRAADMKLSDKVAATTKNALNPFQAQQPKAEAIDIQKN
jgi:uncharacterized protein YrrD